tara:strand:- start:685 stop:1161 length:477 start_codon:yes stop_codon:yes gene_type:complete
MSKWRKPLKNKRRFDARYFLGERLENQQEVVENSVQQEKLKKNFHDFSFDSWLTEDSKPDFLDIDGDGDKEESMKKAAAEKEDVREGHDGATKGRASLAEPTKDDEDNPFDYDKKGKVGGKVVEEESVIGSEEDEEEYGEQEADDSESTEAAPAIREG